MTEQDRAGVFRALHDAPGAFVIANAWDAGSAKLLTALGFKALATSSGAQAGILGRIDGRVNRDEALAHAKAIVDATALPVSADLEKGFGNSPDDAARTIALAGSFGLVGGSIKRRAIRRGRCLHPIHARERIAGGGAGGAIVGFPFVLTARTENYLRGNPNLDDTISRLLAFEAAGADVLMAPGLPDLAAVRAVCAAVSKPVNFMAGIKGKSFTVAELAAAGVKRISLATSLYRAAMTGLLAAATEVRDHGTFAYLDTTLPTPDWNRFMTG